MIKVLLVDDSKPNRVLLGRTLQSLGYIPVLASDGHRALQVLEDNPDIGYVVCDCQMPGMDGPGLVREIRRKEQGPPTPVLLYSSYIGVKDVGNLLEMGATYFLNYPLDRKGLEEYLRRHLEP